MTAFSNHLENELLDLILNQVAYTPTTSSVYVGLHTTSTNDDNSGTEVSGGAYDRKVVTFNTPVSGSTSNAAQIQFSAATSSWGTITHFALYDASTGGNLLLWGPLATSKTVDIGDVFTFPAGNITVTLD